MVYYLKSPSETVDLALAIVISLLVLSIFFLILFFFFTNKLILKRQYFLRSKSLDKMQVLISFDINNKMIDFDKFFTTKIKINQDVFENKMTLHSFEQNIILNKQSEILLKLFKRIEEGTLSQKEIDNFIDNSLNDKIIFYTIDEVTTAKIKINHFNFDSKTMILKCNTIITTFPNKFANTIANVDRTLLTPEKLFLNINKDIKAAKTKKLALIAINFDKKFLEGILYSNINNFFISFSNFIKKNGYETYNQDDFTIYITKRGSNFVKSPKQLLNKWAIILEEFKNEWEEETGINSVEMKFVLTGLEGVISNKNDLLEMLSKIKYELYLKYHQDEQKLVNFNYLQMIKGFNTFEKEILKSKNNSIILRNQEITRGKDFQILSPNLSYEQLFYLNNVYYNSDSIWEKLIDRAILIANKNKNDRFIFKIPKNIIFHLTWAEIKIPTNLFLTLQFNYELSNSDFNELYLIQTAARKYDFSLIIDEPVKLNSELIINLGTKNVFITNGFLKKQQQEFLYDKTYNEFVNWAKTAKDNHIILFK